MLPNRNSIYYFRIAMPKDLRKIFGGQLEIKKSLKTKHRKEAKVSAAHYQSRVESLFYGVRCGMMSDEQAKKIRSKIIGECIENLHNGRAVVPKGLDLTMQEYVGQ